MLTLIFDFDNNYWKGYSQAEIQIRNCKQIIGNLLELDYNSWYYQSPLFLFYFLCIKWCLIRSVKMFPSEMSPSEIKYWGVCLRVGTVYQLGRDTGILNLLIYSMTEKTTLQKTFIRSGEICQGCKIARRHRWKDYA